MESKIETDVTVTFRGTKITFHVPSNNVDDIADELCRLFKLSRAKGATGVTIEPRIFPPEVPDPVTKKEKALAREMALQALEEDKARKIAAKKVATMKQTAEYMPVPKSATIAARACEAALKTTPPLSELQKLIIVRIAFEIERLRRERQWVPIEGVPAYLRKKKNGEGGEVLTGQRCLVNVFIEQGFVTSCLIDFYKNNGRWRHDRQDLAQLQADIVNALDDLCAPKGIVYHDKHGHEHTDTIRWMFKDEERGGWFSPSGIFDLQRAKKFDTLDLAALIRGWMEEGDTYINLRLLVASYAPTLTRGGRVEVSASNVSDKYADIENEHTPKANHARKKQVQQIKRAAKKMTDTPTSVDVIRGKVVLEQKKPKGEN